ncbi:hypothetical protein A2U01_0055315, partial [Trifolium medium]|nr:hypothetical protein [Trifolium medium]
MESTENDSTNEGGISLPTIFMSGIT